MLGEEAQVSPPHLECLCCDCPSTLWCLGAAIPRASYAILILPSGPELNSVFSLGFCLQRSAPRFLRRLRLGEDVIFLTSFGCLLYSRAKGGAFRLN